MNKSWIGARKFFPIPREQSLHRFRNNSCPAYPGWISPPVGKRYRRTDGPLRCPGKPAVILRRHGALDREKASRRLLPPAAHNIYRLSPVSPQHFSIKRIYHFTTASGCSKFFLHLRRSIWCFESACATAGSPVAEGKRICGPLVSDRSSFAGLEGSEGKPLLFEGKTAFPAAAASSLVESLTPRILVSNVALSYIS